MYYAMQHTSSGPLCYVSNYNDIFPGPTSPLDSYEAAQSIFPSIARPLQK